MFAGIDFHRNRSQLVVLNERSDVSPKWSIRSRRHRRPRPRITEEELRAVTIHR